MNRTDKCHRLVGEIAAHFESGITLDHHTKRYIDSCFPEISVRKIGISICENPGADDAPLLELIFSPCETLQIRLEPFLEKSVFRAEDEIRVTGLLREAGIRTTLRGSGTDTPVSVKIPSTVLAPLVRKLRITRQIPRRLIETTHKTFTVVEAARLRVRLRNSRFSFSPGNIDFLDQFFKGINPTTDYFFDCFEIVLDLLNEQKNDSEPYLLLRDKRDLFLGMKKAAVQFMQKLQNSNMETLMHQGVRAPEVGIEEAERKIALLEHAIRALEPGRHLKPENGSLFL